MENIVQCQCGARVRLPEQQQGIAALRCPSCRAVISTGAIAAAFGPATTADGAGAVCPVCQTTIGPAEPVLSCPECRQVHHQECWNEVGGCATYGCKQAPALNKGAAPMQTPLSAWGDTKPCPVCGEKVKSIAVKCRYCGTDFGTVDPLSAADMRNRIAKDESLRSMRVGVIVLFAFSVLGLLAPLMAIISLVWVLPKRKQLLDAGPVYLVLGYVSVALSVLYSILMLSFILF